MVLTVHDELVFESPPEEREALEKLVIDHMQNAVPLSVPLPVDVGWGANWGAAH
jgi:DNA polymerase-1